MVQPCPECFQRRAHHPSCDIGKRQQSARATAERDRAAVAYGFDIPQALLDNVDTGCATSPVDGGPAVCGGE